MLADLEISSTLDSAVNLQQGPCRISHRILSVSLHYLQFMDIDEVDD